MGAVGGILVEEFAMTSAGGLAAVALLLTFASPVAAQTPAPADPPLDNHELLHKYVWSTLGPSGALSATLGAAFEQWRGSPPTWSQEGPGYAQRWASEYAASAIGGTAKYSVARMLHQDPSFASCECSGIAPRLGHALTAPFKARTRDGEWVFSPATLAGITAQDVVPAATWYPAPRGVRDGAAHAITGIAAKMAVDVVHEFLPKRVIRKLF
jgi:hypothetical protein